MKTRRCSKCGEEDTFLICMECLRLEKKKYEKGQTQSSSKTNEVKK